MTTDSESMPSQANSPAAVTDAAVRALAQEERWDDATTLLFRAYGNDLYGFLLSFFRGDEGPAGDAFSEVGERAWRSLPRFEWRCSVRAWLYVLARNAALRQADRKARRGRREVALNDGLASVIEDVRTATRTWQRTHARSAIAQLRDSLDPDDRTLLVLRVDRGLAWDELARVFIGTDDAQDEERLKREAARLRKRYQLVKEKLVKGAKAAGLLDGHGR